MNPELLLVIALIVGGFFLILAEIFLLPGLITGVIGFVLIVWGIVFSYQNFGSSGAAIALVSSCIAGAILIFAMIRLRVWHRFVLKEDQKGQQGFVAPDTSLKELIGKEGETFTSTPQALKNGPREGAHAARPKVGV